VTSKKVQQITLRKEENKKWLLVSLPLFDSSILGLVIVQEEKDESIIKFPKGSISLSFYLPKTLFYIKDVCSAFAIITTISDNVQ
jgi:hypothetical protein